MVLSSLNRPIFILGVFVIYKAVMAVFSFSTNEEAQYVTEIRIAEVVLWSFVSFFAVKEKKPALWIMGIYLVTNVMALFGGLFVVPLGQYILKSVTIVLSIYFVFGGVTLINLARKKSVKAQPRVEVA